MNTEEPGSGRGRDALLTDVQKLADAIGDDYRAMALLAAELGLRWGECAGLQVADVEMLRRTVTIRRNLGEVKGVVIIGEPKTAAGRRTIAASKPLIAELAEHMSRRGLTAERADAWLSAAPQGGPLRYSLFRSRVWTPAVTKADLGGLTFHCLRHSAATAWVAAGVDVRTAQHRLVHSTGRLVLDLCAHVATDADRAAADLMGARLFARPQDAEPRSAP